ncbi:DDE Tnp4 domain-containing protein [Citrus sinensis]|nr:DDE Tnp4 domain-containing protein [Citrus sinensis]
MALCDFDMIFRYVVVGWEGTAHDSRVLTETIRNSRNKFPIPPPDKYYLVDAAYSHTRGFMAPYRHVRYWLGDFRSGGRARGREEIFNHARAKLRNVIERAFGVLKARFPILKRMVPYSFDTQRKIVVACMAIHNFLRKISVDDALFAQYENDEVELESGHSNQNHTANAINSSSIEDQIYVDGNAEASNSNDIGFCYGKLENDLPSATDVINPYKKYSIGKIRLFDPNDAALNALRGSQIDVTLGVRNEDLPNLAASQDAANSWFATNMEPYLKDVVFSLIAVGNQVIPREFCQYVLPVMQILNNILKLPMLRLCSIHCTRSSSYRCELELL